MLAGAVMLHFVGADELVADGDLDGVADHGDLDLAVHVAGGPAVGRRRRGTRTSEKGWRACVGAPGEPFIRCGTISHCFAAAVPPCSSEQTHPFPHGLGVVSVGRGR